MITELEVNGYKSLNGFKIKFEKGLNVIVGPNGSGKTNICQVLALLSSLPNGNFLNYLNYLGGTNSIFSKQNDSKFINVTAIGNCLSYYKKITYDLKYTYNIYFKIENDSLSLIESLIIQRRTSKKYKQILKIYSRDGNINSQIIDRKLLGEYSKMLEKHKTITFELDKTDCLWSIMPKLFYACYTVGSDIVKLRMINIEPNVVREPCDIIDSERMLGNGKYLANELYRLLKDEKSKYEIESLLEQTLPNYKEIKVETSSSDFKRHITIITKNDCSFHSANLSDGTLKLIAVLVAIINQVNYTVIIEEIENFLYPKVDRLLIEYLRESFIDRSCILTSHSETVLNSIRPEELIICNNNNGSTTCTRIADIKLIQEIINESGLGCGYHYVMGNLN